MTSERCSAISSTRSTSTSVFARGWLLLLPWGGRSYCIWKPLYVERCVRKRFEGPHAELRREKALSLPLTGPGPTRVPFPLKTVRIRFSTDFACRREGSRMRLCSRTNFPLREAPLFSAMEEARIARLSNREAPHDVEIPDPDRRGINRNAENQVPTAFLIRTMNNPQYRRPIGRALLASRATRVEDRAMWASYAFEYRRLCNHWSRYYLPPCLVCAQSTGSYCDDCDAPYCTMCEREHLDGMANRDCRSCRARAAHNAFAGQEAHAQPAPVGTTHPS